MPKDVDCRSGSIMIWRSRGPLRRRSLGTPELLCDRVPGRIAPDAFAPKGQDWAFPPPNTIAHRENGYQLFRESIRKIVKHGGALRIDHVMRLFRLFWIPDGVEAADGVYVSDNVTDLLRVLALESVRSRNIIIGEDLGTVTDEMRETLARFGVLSYRLFYFEKRKDASFKRSSDYPRQALVSSTTHDLPTLAGFWTHRDIEDRDAGLINEEAYRSQIADRLREKQRLCAARTGITAA